MIHFLPVSLLAILAGTLLLIKIKKDGLGKFFSFISWFFIVTGFILFIGFMTSGILRMSHCGKTGRPEFRHEMMMKGCQQRMHDGSCCPAKKGMCMEHDSLMKGCCKADTAKMPCCKPPV
jgi:hypothetical protein